MTVKAIATWQHQQAHGATRAESPCSSCKRGTLCAQTNGGMLAQVLRIPACLLPDCHRTAWNKAKEGHLAAFVRPGKSRPVQPPQSYLSKLRGSVCCQTHMHLLMITETSSLLTLWG